MDKLDSAARPSSPTLSPLAIGTICGLFAAVGYTATNICLKQVANDNLNAFFVSSIKALPTLLICAPWAMFQSQSGIRVMPTPKVFWLLFCSALVGQIGGNVGFQFGLQYIGMGISVAICLGTIQIFGAILSRIFLGEPVTNRAVAAIAILLLALAALSAGAKLPDRPFSTLEIAMGIASLCVSGFSYAVVGVAIRYGVTGRTTIAFTLSVSGGLGFVCLGLIALAQAYNADAITADLVSSPAGPAVAEVGGNFAELVGTTQKQWLVMLAAGVLNAISFLALTKAYQVTTVTYVAIMNACQTAMAAVVGVLVFRENWTLSLTIGLILTALGVTLMALKRGKPKYQTETDH